jgi:hypothetical protein
VVWEWGLGGSTEVLQEAGAEATIGRGLMLVEAVSSEWETYAPEGSTGKVVWALAAE